VKFYLETLVCFQNVNYLCRRFQYEIGHKGSKNLIITSMNSVIDISKQRGLSQKIGKIFKRSQPFIRKALRGESSHPDAVKIRKAALENGGRELIVKQQ
jgi:hypothetical protein